MQREPEPEVMDIDAEAEAYATADFADVNEAFVARLLDLAGPVERVRALDLGTGPGDIVMRLLRARPGWSVLAVDAAFPMLRLAQQAGEGERAAFWIQSDAKALALPSDRFDVVFSNSILHHITEVDPLWGELRRVARPGALVFLRDLARPADPDAARLIVERYAGSESALLQEEFYRSLLSAYTPEEVRTQLARNGLGMLEVTQVTDRHLDVFGRLR